MKLFYKKVHETFTKPINKKKYTDAGISPVEHINLYAGQDFIPEEFDGFKTPALLLNWNINYSTTPPKANITATLCYEQLRDTSNNSKNLDAALGFIDFTSITDEILKSIETQNTGKLTLVSEGNKIDETVTESYELVYECSYNGKTSAPNTGYIKGTIDTILESQKGIFTKLND